MTGLDIEEGGEYKGERYIRCLVHLKLFEGTTIQELIWFLVEHIHCGTDRITPVRQPEHKVQ
jgi:hypothetical protein